MHELLSIQTWQSQAGTRNKSIVSFATGLCGIEHELTVTILIVLQVLANPNHPHGEAVRVTIVAPCMSTPAPQKPAILGATRPLILVVLV